MKDQLECCGYCGKYFPINTGHDCPNKRELPVTTESKVTHCSKCGKDYYVGLGHTCEPFPANTKFETGAVRSADRVKVRYDLITPIGMKRLGRQAAIAMRQISSESGNKALSLCLGHIFDFLSGNTEYDKFDHLAQATLCLFHFLQIDRKNGYELKNWDDTIRYRYDLIPPEGLKAVAEAYAEGAVKYSAFNWEKGMPVHDILNHAIAHILDWLSGDRSEDHLGHCGWNLMAAMHSQVLWPKLNEGQLRINGCVPPNLC